MEITITGFITKEYINGYIKMFVEKIEFDDSQFIKLHYDYVVSKMPKELDILVSDRLYCT